MTNNSIQGECPKCNTITPMMRPQCIKCGKWQAWGDQARFAMRLDRLREFRQSEEQIEAEWTAARYTPESHAPRLPLRYSVLASWHTLQLEMLCNTLFNPARVAGLALGLAITFGAGFGFNSYLSHRASSAPEITIAAAVAPYSATNFQPVDAYEKPHFICEDGSPSYAENSRGACSGHGGIKEALK